MKNLQILICLSALATAGPSMANQGQQQGIAAAVSDTLVPLKFNVQDVETAVDGAQEQTAAFESLYKSLYADLEIVAAGVNAQGQLAVTVENAAAQERLMAYMKAGHTLHTHRGVHYFRYKALDYPGYLPLTLIEIKPVVIQAMAAQFSAEAQELKAKETLDSSFEQGQRAFIDRYGYSAGQGAFDILAVYVLTNGEGQPSSVDQLVERMKENDDYEVVQGLPLFKFGVPEIEPEPVAAQAYSSPVTANQIGGGVSILPLPVPTQPLLPGGNWTRLPDTIWDRGDFEANDSRCDQLARNKYHYDEGRAGELIGYDPYGRAIFSCYGR